MTTETMTEPPAVTEEVIEDLRGLLAEALQTQANICSQSAAHLEELGDAEAAEGELGVALLTMWLSDNVRTWTHTTRLREGLTKFDPVTAAKALTALIADDQPVDESDPEWRP